MVCLLCKKDIASGGRYIGVITVVEGEAKPVGVACESCIREKRPEWAKRKWDK